MVFAKFGYVVAAIAVAVVLIVIIRIKNILTGEWFRKLLHLICLILLGGLIFFFSTWIEAAIAMIMLVAVIFPIFKLLEKTDWFERFLASRKKGELAMSLVITGIMFIIVTSVCEGIFGNRMLAVASIYAWGPGDAAAALIGCKYGKHKLGKDKKKSVEGTVAMFITSLLCVVPLLYLDLGSMSPAVLVIAAVTALAAAISELFSKNGNDTIICPVTSMIVLLLMYYITGNLSVNF